MNIKEFSRSTQRTANPDLNKLERIKNALFGINGEAGELIDLFKKHFFQGHSINFEEVKNELGDVLYYFCDLCEILKLDIDEIARMNIEKRKKRYPEGFEKENSINRS